MGGDYQKFSGAKYIILTCLLTVLSIVQNLFIIYDYMLSVLGYLITFKNNDCHSLRMLSNSQLLCYRFINNF